MAMSTMPIIETGRLLLRGPTSADIDVLATFIADAEFGRSMPRNPVVNPLPRGHPERLITIHQQRRSLWRWDGPSPGKPTDNSSGLAVWKA
jgi:hypothetical protein